MPGFFFILKAFCSTLNSRIGQLENWRIRFLMSRTGYKTRSDWLNNSYKQKIIDRKIRSEFWNRSCISIPLLSYCEIRGWMYPSLKKEKKIYVMSIIFIFRLSFIIKAELLQVGIFFLIHLFAWEVLLIKKIGNRRN